MKGSETFVIVLGTLAMSAGVNLLTNLTIWKGDKPEFSDLTLVLFAIPSVLFGSVLFFVTEFCRDWADRNRSLAKGLKVDGDAVEAKRRFIAQRLESDNGKRLVRLLRFCAWLYVAGSITVGLSLAGCGKDHHEAGQGTGETSASTKVVVQMGYQETALYRHVFTAKAKGFFEAEGIQPVIRSFASGNQMAQGILSGDLDFAGLANMEVALTIQAKDPNRFEIVNFLVWGTNSYPDYIVCRKESGVRTLKDFEGKTMGLHPGSAVKGFSKAVLQTRGVDLAKVKFLELQPAMMKDALAVGRVDGLYCMDPVATVLIESGLCTVILANPMQDIFPPPVPISGTAISRKFLKEHPKAAAAVARALERAIKYMREPGHEREIAGYIAQYTPITAEQALRMNVSDYWTLSEFDRGRVQKLADRFVELGIVEKPVDTKEFLAPPDFLEKTQR